MAHSGTATTVNDVRTTTGAKLGTRSSVVITVINVSNSHGAHIFMVCRTVTFMQMRLFLHRNAAQ